MIKYENKLIELMGEEGFNEFASEIARDIFAEEIMNMASSDFKQTILDNFDVITGSEEDYLKFLAERNEELLNKENEDDNEDD